MPPVLAATFSLLLTAVLLWWDRRRRADLTAATWIPTLWLFFMGSRSVTQWIYLGTPIEELTANLLDGSPLERTVFSGLILCSLIVLFSRRVAWGSVLTRNGWFLLFIVYCLISVAWADYPFVSFKRWIKAIGDPLIVLVLLTERNPAGAMVAVLRRCAFFLIPMSVVFIKYYPELGHTYDSWTGVASYTGVTTNKNLLGYLLFVFGLLFVCTWTERQRIQDQSHRRVETGICALLLFLIAYLFYLANSQTAFVAFAVSAMIAMAVRRATIRRHIGAIAVCLIAATWVVMATNLSGFVLAALGRDATLTGRTDLWEAVLPMAVHPLFGAGFESFWLGPRLASLWAQFAFRPTQAHNGYIEMYLNLGIVGLTLFMIFLVASFGSVRRALHEAYAAPDTVDVNRIIVARFGVGYVIAMVAYNVTEATFKPSNFLFILLLLLVVRYHMAPAVETNRAAVAPRWRRPDESTALPQLPLRKRWVAERRPAVPWSGLRGRAPFTKPTSR